MLRQDQRWISHCLLSIRPTPSQAPYIGLEQLLDRLEQRIAAGTAKDDVLEESVTFGIKEYFKDDANNCITLLFQVNDSRASDPAFGDLETFDLRYERKQDGEGGAASGQLVVSLDEVIPDSKTYYAFLENVSGINRSRIQRLLRNLGHDIATDLNLTFESPATGKHIAYRPLFTLAPRPSISLATALETGTLTQAKLVKTSPRSDGLDEENWVEDVTEVLTFRAKRDLSVSRALAAIRRAVEIGKGRNAQKLQVSVRDDGKMTSLELNLAESSPTEALLMKLDPVALEEPHDVARDSISEPLREAMTAILVEVRTSST